MKLDLSLVRSVFKPDVIAIGLMLSGIEVVVLKVLWRAAFGAAMPLVCEGVLLAYLVAGFISLCSVVFRRSLFEVVDGKLGTLLKLQLLAHFWPFHKGR